MLGLMSVAWGSGKSPKGWWLVIGIAVTLLYLYSRSKDHAIVP